MIIGRVEFLALQAVKKGTAINFIDQTTLIYGSTLKEDPKKELHLFKCNVFNCMWAFGSCSHGRTTVGDTLREMRRHNSD